MDLKSAQRDVIDRTVYSNSVCVSLGGVDQFVSSLFVSDTMRDVTFVNSFSLEMLVCDIARRGASWEGWVFPDGIFMSFLMSLLTFRSVRRASFDQTSFAPSVFDYCSKNGKRIFLVGSTKEKVEKAVTIIQEFHPGLMVSGRSGYFAGVEDLQLFQSALLEENPDVVVCGMGTPKQEIFLAEMREMGWGGVGFTCGGYIEQTADQGYQYYPWIIDTLNLRWCYRMWKEPRRLFCRYAFEYPVNTIRLISRFILR